MKKVLFIVFIFIQISSLFAQLNRDDISFELRYPKPIGDNFIHKSMDEGYRGLADIGVDYTMFKINNLGIGVMLNASILSYSVTDVTLLILSPKLKMDYTIDYKKISIVPCMALGYSNWHFRSPGVEQYDKNGDPTGVYKYRENEAGFSFKGGTKIVFKSSSRISWYALLAYEFTKLEKPANPVLDSKFNRNIQLLYPGLGFIYKFRHD